MRVLLVAALLSGCTSHAYVSTVHPGPRTSRPAPPPRVAVALDPSEDASTCFGAGNTPLTEAMQIRDDTSGWLRINTRPPTQVLVDGQLVGDTPQMGISLPVGRHTVTLINPNFGIHETITVGIAPLPRMQTRCLTLLPG